MQQHRNEAFHTKKRGYSLSSEYPLLKILICQVSLFPVMPRRIKSPIAALCFLHFSIIFEPLYTYGYWESSLHPSFCVHFLHCHCICRSVRAFCIVITSVLPLTPSASPTAPSPVYNKFPAVPSTHYASQPLRCYARH